MGRSAKEYCRPNQACDYGGPVANADTSKIAVAGDKSGVKVKSEDSSGMKRAKAQRPKLSKETKQDLADQSRTDEADSGWDKIGAAGADIIRTRAAYKDAAAKKKSGGGTSGVPA